MTSGPVVRAAEILRSFAAGGRTILSDRPLRLAGAAGMAPSGLPSTLPLDWHAELAGFVDSVCRRRTTDGCGWLVFPPAALVSEPGVGRLHAVRQIARHAGLPHFVWDVADDGRPARFHPCDGDVRTPSGPVLAMLASGCANPVVSVVGAGTARPDVLRMLDEMTDPRGCRRWVDEGAGAGVDLSNVSWFVSWNEGDVAPRWFEKRFERIVLRWPAPGRERLLALSLLDEIIADGEARSAIGADVLADVLAAARRDRPLSETFEQVAGIVASAPLSASPRPTNDVNEGERM